MSLAISESAEEALDRAVAVLLEVAAVEGAERKEAERTGAAAGEAAEEQRLSLEELILAREADALTLGARLGEAETLLCELDDSLSSFLSEMTTVSGDVVRLEAETREATRLARVVADTLDRLQDVVGTLTIDDGVRSQISNGSVASASYDRALGDVSRAITRLATQRSADGGGRGIRALDNFEQELEELVAIAVSRSTEYISDLFSDAARSADRRLAAQQTLSGRGKLYQFLFKHAPRAAQEALDVSVSLGAKAHGAELSSYLQELLRLAKPPSLTKADTLASPETTNRLRSAFTAARFALSTGVSPMSNGVSESGSMKGRTSVFTLGGRDAVVEKCFAPPVTREELRAAEDRAAAAAAATAGGSNGHTGRQSLPLIPYEEVFRSWLLAFVRAVAGEAMFATDFFLRGDLSEDNMCGTMFGDIMATWHASLAKRLSVTYDGLQLLVLMCLARSLRDDARRRMIAALDEFFDEVVDAVRSRFLAVMRLNVESLVRAAQHPRMTLGSTKVEKTSPHFVTRRYGEFIAAALQLDAKFLTETDVRADLLKVLPALRKAFASLLARLSQSLPDPRSRTIFYLNNTGLILSLLRLRALADGASAEERAWQSLHSTHTSIFAEDMARRHLGELITYAREVKPFLDTDGTPSTKPGGGGLPPTVTDVKRVLAIQAKFAEDRETLMTAIGSECRSAFSDLDAGTRILATVLDVMLGYYQDFARAVATLPSLEAARTAATFVPEAAVRSDFQTLREGGLV
jgi:hypothetical protein